VVLAFGAAAGVPAGAEVDAGLLAGAAEAVLGAAAGVGLLAGAALAEGAAAGAAPAVLSAEVAVLDLLFFVVAVSGLAAVAAVVLPVALLLAVALSAASALLLFFELFFEVVVAESLEAVASVLAAVFCFDLDLGVFVESALASVPLCDASAVAAFFLVFFLVAALVSLWSFEVVDPVCCTPRVATLPQIRNVATSSAKYTPLLDLILLLPQAQIALSAKHTCFHCVGRVQVAKAFRADFPCWEFAHHPGERTGSQGETVRKRECRK